MMKYFFIVVVMLVSCSRTPPEIQASIDRLTQVEKQTKQEIKSLETAKGSLEQQVANLSALREEVRVLEYQKNGGDVEYVLEMELSQERPLSASLKDMMNATTFKINVDRRTYNHYQIGDVYFKDLREGSVLTEGSVSSWLIKVKDKHTNTL